MYRDLIRLLLLFKVALLVVIALLLYMAFPSIFDRLGDLQFMKSKPGKTKENVEEEGEEFRIEAVSLLNEAENMDLVLKHCTACHSARLIVQNRKSKERWKENIRWMQSTQGLWDLGSDEQGVLDYLSANYSDSYTGRRMPLELQESDWYILK